VEPSFTEKTGYPFNGDINSANCEFAAKNRSRNDCRKAADADSAVAGNRRGVKLIQAMVMQSKHS
jgi:hypothetical protein